IDDPYHSPGVDRRPVPLHRSGSTIRTAPSELIDGRYRSPRVDRREVPEIWYLPSNSSVGARGHRAPQRTPTPPPRRRAHPHPAPSRSGPGAGVAVQRRGDRLEGGAGDRAVDADAPENPVVDLALDVGGGEGVVALGQGVLGVVEDPHVDLPLGQRLDEAVQRAVADT